MELCAENISREYARPTGEGNRFFAVRPMDIRISGGTLTVVTGRSGSGKTTLLNMLGGLLLPSSGTVSLDGTDLYRLRDRDLARLRNRCIGVIPQGRSVLDALSVWENLLLPGDLYGKGEENGNEREERAGMLLEKLGIANLKNASPKELSGGELRRLSVARALLLQPKVLLADEPTGDLDDENTQIVLTLLKSEAEKGTAVLLVTHEMEALPYADAVYRMDAGEIVQESRTESGREDS